jgi:hypothetical protein
MLCEHSCEKTKKLEKEGESSNYVPLFEVDVLSD